MGRPGESRTFLGDLLRLGRSAGGPKLGTSARRADVVFTFSYSTWQVAADRGWFHSEDRLARFLVGAPRVDRLLVCEQVRSLPRKLLRDRLGPSPVPFPAGPDRRLVSPVRLGRINPTTIPELEVAFATYDRMLRRAARRMGLEDPVVITAHPLVAGFAELAWARAVTFYAVDDWAQHPAYRAWWPAYREATSRARELGRRMAAVSTTLLQRLDPIAQGIVVPNGLDPDEWTHPGPPPAWVDGLSRPLLVYAGALDTRLDVDALRCVTRDLPHATVVLAGPVGDTDHLAALRMLPGVVVFPSLPRREIAGLIRAADVGLIPHVRSRLTEAMCPLKLYEYLAAGRPVAATDLLPVRGVHASVALAATSADFAGTVLEALASGPLSEHDRLLFVAANSWGLRHGRLLDLALA